MPKLSRSDFLKSLGVLGAGSLMSSSAGERAFSGQRVRVGVIGCGSVSNMYLPHLSRSPFVELVSVCDIRPERADAQGEKYNVRNRYPHIDRMLAGAPFDLMVNLTNMQEHGRLNRQALLAGRHVWSEKPMADTYAEGRALLDLAQSKGLRIWGAPAVVNSPQFAFMARTLRGADSDGWPPHTPITVIPDPPGRPSSTRREEEACPTWASTISPPYPDSWDPFGPSCP